jgi:hypothetical protein
MRRKSEVNGVRTLFPPSINLMGEQIGYVTTWSHPSRPGAVGIYSNFVGGVPHTSPPLIHPSCSNCGTRLFLVLQLYAPTDRERFLYIFGCNNIACMEAPGAWVVLRRLGDFIAIADEDASAVGGEAAPDAPTDMWGGGDGSGGGGGWGMASEWEGAAADLEGTAASMAILAATTAALSLEASAATASVSSLPALSTAVAAAAAVTGRQIRRGGSDREASSSSSTDVPSFPCFLIETAYGETSGAASESESDSDDELLATTTTTGSAPPPAAVHPSSRAASADWAYAQRLLEVYNAREALENNTISTTVVAGGSHAVALAELENDGGGGNNNDNDDNEDNEDNDDSGAIAADDERGRRRGGGHNQGGSSGSGGGERYEKTPAKLRYLLRFQRRLARFPTQVIRYVWDAPNDVLWPIHPAARPRAPLPCACGAKRRLEVQILPSCLFGLGVEDGPGGGMDFLSLLIYACEAACESGKEEVIVAIPA